MKPFVLSFLFAFGVQVASLVAQIVPVTVTVTDSGRGADLSAHFMGLSYETSMLLPKDGRYYFNPNDEALINTFRTLGIKSLRIGGNSVDDSRVAIPQEKDIDVLFRFARAAGVKVIYSFRLKRGNPADSARLARYIVANYADALDCFAIGNEPNVYLPTYEAYLPQWKLQYHAILQAVPQATFDGPSVNGRNNYALNLARDMFPAGHLAMASEHYYFMGSGEEGERDPEGTRDKFLSNNTHWDYQQAYDRVGGVLAREHVPYRIDELNSCFNGGAKGSSDTYASTLWALDCTHWWAARPILGLNYHTTERPVGGGDFTAANYASFVHTPGGGGIDHETAGLRLSGF